eukprot:GHRQ01028888.1.p3 GENE.GHRQ01028888.1~~GHRQ01028888.1.p3  ORF type:complete len:119 (+),score=9.66 GHRQ01028888.1:514-870(+)
MLSPGPETQPCRCVCYGMHTIHTTIGMTTVIWLCLTHTTTMLTIIMGQASTSSTQTMRYWQYLRHLLCNLTTVHHTSRPMLPGQTMCLPYHLWHNTNTCVSWCVTCITQPMQCAMHWL